MAMKMTKSSFQAKRSMFLLSKLSKFTYPMAQVRKFRTFPSLLNSKSESDKSIIDTELSVANGVSADAKLELFAKEVNSMIFSTSTMTGMKEIADAEGDEEFKEFLTVFSEDANNMQLQDNNLEFSADEIFDSLPEGRSLSEAEKGKYLEKLSEFEKEFEQMFGGKEGLSLSNSDVSQEQNPLIRDQLIELHQRMANHPNGKNLIEETWSSVINRPVDMPKDTEDRIYNSIDIYCWKLIDKLPVLEERKIELKHQLIHSKFDQRTSFVKNLFRQGYAYSKVSKNSALSLFLKDTTGEKAEIVNKIDDSNSIEDFLQNLNHDDNNMGKIANEVSESKTGLAEDKRLDSLLENNSFGMEYDLEDIPKYSKHFGNEHEIDGAPIRSSTDGSRGDFDVEIDKNYLYAADEDLMKNYSPIVQRTLSVTNANATEMKKHRIAMGIKRFGKFEGDTGAPACTAIALTEKVESLTAHLRYHVTDRNCKRDLEILLAKRRRYFRYFRAKDFELYREVINYLGVRDIGFPDVGQHQRSSYRPRFRKYDPLKCKHNHPNKHPVKLGKKKRKIKTKKMWRRNK